MKALRKTALATLVASITTLGALPAMAQDVTIR